MRLLAKVLKGPMAKVEVDETDNILTVKTMLQDLIDIPVDQQKIVFKGKTLTDYSTIGECGLQADNRIYVVQQSGSSGTDGDKTSANSLPIVPGKPEDVALSSELRRFLRRHFTPENAELVLQEYKKNLQKTINNLNLDDIERLATAKLTGTHLEVVDMEALR